jgi:hypothetical protein
MQHRATLGWIFAAAFCASVSCGGGNDAIPGFGLKCATIGDCAQYSLKCGPNNTCVVCVDNAACNDGEVCQAGVCKALQQCKTQKDCKSGTVCDTDMNVCVECLLSSDCSSTQGCIDQQCVERKPCTATSDCSKDGLVCDRVAGVCVTCRTTQDCGVRQVCEDHDCVPEPKDTTGAGGEGGVDSGGTSGTGGGGNGGRAGSGGKGGTGGFGGFGGMSGGTNGAAGNGGNSGNGGNGGMSGSGGTGPCGCLNTEVCTPDMRCVSPKLIDDLDDCNATILEIEGRKGDWYAEADTGISQTHGYDDPGVGAPMINWKDLTCAAWTTGTPVGNTNQTYERIGFDLNAGMAYDLSLDTGLQVKLESSVGVQVVIKTTGGGFFALTLGPIAGSNLRTAPFASPSMKPMANSLEGLPIKLDTVYEIEFWAVDPKSPFDMAVHRVELY